MADKVKVKCVECGVEVEGIRNHNRTVHNSDNKCYLCEKEFASSIILYGHMKLIHGQQLGYHKPEAGVQDVNIPTVSTESLDAMYAKYGIKCDGTDVINSGYSISISKRRKGRLEGSFEIVTPNTVKQNYSPPKSTNSPIILGDDKMSYLERTTESNKKGVTFAHLLANASQKYSEAAYKDTLKVSKGVPFHAKGNSGPLQMGEHHFIVVGENHEWIALQKLVVYPPNPIKVAVNGFLLYEPSHIIFIATFTGKEQQVYLVPNEDPGLHRSLMYYKSDIATALALCDETWTVPLVLPLSWLNHKLFKCLKCISEFGDLHQLRIHGYRHRGNKCPTCKMDGIEMEDDEFLSHVMTHTLIKCGDLSGCEKTFFNKKDLSNHKLQHENGNYTCNVCSKTFSVRRNYMNHTASHETEPKFGCKFCERKFTTRSKKDTHQRHYHTRVTATSTEDCNLARSRATISLPQATSANVMASYERQLENKDLKIAKLERDLAAERSGKGKRKRQVIESESDSDDAE